MTKQNEQKILNEEIVTEIYLNRLADLRTRIREHKLLIAILLIFVIMFNFCFYCNIQILKKIFSNHQQNIYVSEVQNDK